MSTTHQTAVSETGAAPADGRISSLVVYAVSTLLIAAAATAGGLIATRADPATSAGPTAAAYAPGQQFLDGVDPSINVRTALGLARAQATVDPATALVDGIDPSINVRTALGLTRAQATVDPTTALVDGIDPSVDVRTALGLARAEATVDPTTALVDGIDPSIDVRHRPRTGTRR